MARGSIVWHCSKCGNLTKGSCEHPGAKYYTVLALGTKRKWEAASRTKKDAERRLSEILAGFHQGTYIPPTKILFKDFAETWLKDSAGLKPTTLQFYRTLFKIHLAPAFGHLLLNQISPQLIKNFQSRCLSEKKLSPKTTNSLLTTLKTALNYAEWCGHLRENPAKRVKPVKTNRKEMEFFSPEEIRRLLANSDEPAKTLFLTAALTGMRIGELLALQWGDIDWHSNVVRVRRTLYFRYFDSGGAPEKQKWSFSTPKSNDSNRTIRISPKLREALELHRLVAPVSPHDLIFCTSKGTPINPRNLVRREFLPALIRAGLKRIRFHDLRHTYTTLLIAQGENIKFIQSQLGHASIQTTLDRYGHLLPDAGKDVGERLDAFVFGAGDRLASNARLTEQAKTVSKTLDQA